VLIGLDCDQQVHFPLLPMIGKENRLVTTMHPMIGVPSPRMATVRRNMVVHSDSIDNDLLLVWHDARVDLNPSGTRFCYTQESVLLAELTLCSPRPYIVAWWWAGVAHVKVLILNPDYKGKCHMESFLSNPALRMER
jgi:hypothetical protein